MLNNHFSKKKNNFKILAIFDLYFPIKCNGLNCMHYASVAENIYKLTA